MILRAAKEHGLLAVPGFFTPTEAFAMLAEGADALKLFPAEAATPAMLRAMRAVLPAGTAVLPVGGIDASNIAPGARPARWGSASVRRSTGRGQSRDGWRQGTWVGGGTGGLAGGPSRFFPTLENRVTNGSRHGGIAR